MNEIYLMSDTHFNHAGILGFMPKTRGIYDTVQDMNEDIIEKWNAAVTSKDIVWFLGDFAFSEKNSTMSNEAIFNALNGNKHLVIGNHDEKNKKILKLGWASQTKLHSLRHSDGEQKIRFELCHYPMETWKNAHNTYMHAHGHSHGNLKNIIARRFDVGFDSPVTCGYPMNVIDLWNIGMRQEYNPVDHHA